MSLARAQLLTQEAAALAVEPYTLALAATVEGLDASAHWAEFGRILERAYVLVGLEAVADANGAVRRSSSHIFESFDRDDELVSIEAGPFLDAVQQFEDRVPRLASEVRRLIDEAVAVSLSVVDAEMSFGFEAAMGRTRLAEEILRGSFWATSTTTGELLDLRSILGGILRGDLDGKGLTALGVRDFITEAQARGIRNLSTLRLETIYRNNLSSSYSEAAAATLERDNVSNVLPLVMLNEIRDRRTRGNPAGLYPKGFHWHMDGYVGTMSEFRDLGIIPPNGHLCRGGIRGITTGEAISNGWMDERGQIDRIAISEHNGERLAIIQRGDYPDPGFKGA